MHPISDSSFKIASYATNSFRASSARVYSSCTLAMLPAASCSSTRVVDKHILLSSRIPSNQHPVKLISESNFPGFKLIVLPLIRLQGFSQVFYNLKVLLHCVLVWCSGNVSWHWKISHQFMNEMRQFPLRQATRNWRQLWLQNPQQGICPKRNLDFEDTQHGGMDSGRETSPSPVHHQLQSPSSIPSPPTDQRDLLEPHHPCSPNLWQSPTCLVFWSQSVDDIELIFPPPVDCQLRQLLNDWTLESRQE